MTAVTSALVRSAVPIGAALRFDRGRYDGERAANVFASRLRGRVDLVGLQSDLSDSVDYTFRPSSTGVWIRDVPVQAPARPS